LQPQGLLDLHIPGQLHKATVAPEQVNDFLELANEIVGRQLA